MPNHPRSVIKQINISEILAEVYPPAFCIEIAMHCYETCGEPCDCYEIRQAEYVVLDEDGEVKPSLAISSQTLTKQQMQIQTEPSLIATKTTDLNQDSR